jgi:hypothetical protein
VSSKKTSQYVAVLDCSIARGFVPARHRSRLPARALQWQAGSGEAGGNAPKGGAVDVFNYGNFWA